MRLVLLMAFAVMAMLVLLPDGRQGLAWGFNLTLVHTANTQSSITAMDLFAAPCSPFNNTHYISPNNGQPCLGGVARLKTVIDGVRARSANVMQLDAGGILQSSLFYFLFGSSFVADYYVRLGYDFVHWQVLDFVALVPNLVEFMNATRGSGIDYVVSNLSGFDEDSRTGGALVVPYAVKSFAGGESVGFVATLGADLNSLVAYSGDINSTDEIRALSVAVASLQNLGVNKVVASVSGNATAQQALEMVPGIDVLVVPQQLQSNTPGPSGVVGPYPIVHRAPWNQPVLVVSSGSFGQLAGVLDVSFDANGVITSWSGDSVLMDASVTPDPTFQNDIIAQYALVQSSYATVIGHVGFNLSFETNCLFSECTIGDWTADVIRRFSSGAQIAFNNGGSIRAGIAAGPVTLGQEQTAFPFGTSMHYVYKLKGRHVFEALENGVSLATNYELDVNSGPGRFLQVAGVRFSWNPNEAVGYRVVDAYVELSPGRWQLLDMEANYTVSSFEWFVILGGDGYTMVRDNAFDLKGTGYSYNAMFLQALTSAENVTVGVETGRISTTTAYTRRDCLAPDGSYCYGNGYCFEGRCVCTAQGHVEPTLCAPVNSSSSSSSSDGLGAGAIAGIAVGSVVPVALILVALSLITLGSLIYARRKAALTDDDWAIDMNELELGELLGQGGYGEVYKAKWKGDEVAVKLMNQASVTKATVADFTQEARVMSKLRHPNVVLFMAACIKPPNLLIVMEFMQLGSLFDLLHNELIPEIPLQLKVKLAHQAAKGMHFLHSSDIAHRDLKSLNLLIDVKWNVKVADFGLTRFKESIKSKEQVVGSVHWMAPEVLSDQAGVDYTLADVYSFGIILWEVLTREQPYEGMLSAQIAIEVIRNDMRPRVPEEPGSEAEAKYMELMAGCWKRDPSDRPTFDLIIGWLEDIASLGAASSSSGCTKGSGNGGSSSSSNSFSSAYGSSRYYSQRHYSGRSSALGTDRGASVSASSSDDAGLAALVGPIVPRHNVSYAVCDLARMDLAWQSDPTGAERIVERYTLLVRKHAAANSAHVFSPPSLHSGGTFTLAFATPIKAAAFALALLADTQLDDVLRGISRIALHYSAGINMHPVGDHTKSTYERRHYQEACRINVLCRPSAVLCSIAFRDACRTLDDAGFSFSEPTGGSFVRLLDDGAHDDGDYADQHDGNGGEDHPAEDGLCSSNSCPWIVDTGKLEVGERIGEGTYGQVYIGSYVGRPVAIKRLFNSRLNDEAMRRTRREAALLSGIDHPNVVKLMGLSITLDGDIMLVMELVSGGNLRSLLSSPRKLRWTQRLSMLRDAAIGLSALHSRGIVHRDVKSSNLLVDRDTLSVKVCDFGFARAKQDNATMTRCGTPAWTAPEVLLPARRDGLDRDGSHDEKADVYSFAIVMWEVLTRRKPYEEDHSLVSIIEKVLQGYRPVVPQDAPPEFAHLMQRCWHAKPHKRPSMPDVIVGLNSMLENCEV